MGNSNSMVTTISPSTFLSAIKEAVAAKAIRQVGQERLSGERIMKEKLEGIFCKSLNGRTFSTNDLTSVQWHKIQPLRLPTLFWWRTNTEIISADR